MDRDRDCDLRGRRGRRGIRRSKADKRLGARAGIPRAWNRRTRIA